MTISEQLRELLAKATPGGWETDELGEVIDFPDGSTMALLQYQGRPADATLIVFLRNNAPHFAALEEENVRLRKSLSWALSKVSKPHLVVGQNEEHCAAYQSARAALQEQPR